MHYCYFYFYFCTIFRLPMTFVIFFLSTFTDAYRHGAGSSQPLRVVSNLWHRAHRQVQPTNRCHPATSTYILNSTVCVHFYEKTTPKPEYHNQVQCQEFLNRSNDPHKKIFPRLSITIPICFCFLSVPCATGLKAGLKAFNLSIGWLHFVIQPKVSDQNQMWVAHTSFPALRVSF